MESQVSNMDQQHTNTHDDTMQQPHQQQQQQGQPHNHQGGVDDGAMYDDNGDAYGNEQEGWEGVYGDGVCAGC